MFNDLSLYLLKLCWALDINQTMSANRHRHSHKTPLALTHHLFDEKSSFSSLKLSPLNRERIENITSAVCGGAQRGRVILPFLSLMSMSYSVGKCPCPAQCYKAVRYFKHQNRKILRPVSLSE